MFLFLPLSLLSIIHPHTFCSAAKTPSLVSSVDFAAAEPTTYYHEEGGGNYVTGGNAYVIESLGGQGFACGDVVSFISRVAMSSDAGTGASVALDYAFAAAPTGKTGVALTSATAVLVNDPSLDSAVQDNGNGRATLVAQALTGPTFEKKSELLVRVILDGADANEVLVVRVDAQLECLAGASPSGTLKAAQEFVLAATAGSSSYVDQKVGQQTVPFNALGSVAGVGEPLVQLDACFACVEPCTCDVPSTLRRAVGGNQTLPILSGTTGTASVRHCAIFANRGTVATSSMAVGHGADSGFANLNGAASFTRVDGTASNSLGAGERAAWTHVSTVNRASLATKVGHTSGDWAVVFSHSCRDTGSGATGPAGRAVAVPPSHSIGITKERLSDPKHRAGSDSAVEYRVRLTGNVQAKEVVFVDRLPSHLSLNLATAKSVSGASGMVSTVVPSTNGVTVRLTGPGNAAFTVGDAQLDLLAAASLGAMAGTQFNWASACARSVTFGGPIYSLGSTASSGITLPDLCAQLSSPAAPVEVAYGCANNTAPTSAVNAPTYQRSADAADTAAIDTVASASSKSKSAVTSCVRDLDICYSTCGVEQVATCVVAFLSCVAMPATTPVMTQKQLYASVPATVVPAVTRLARSTAFDEAQRGACLCPVVPLSTVVVVPPPALESWPFVEDDSDFAATAPISTLYEEVNISSFVPNLSSVLGDEMTTAMVERPDVVAMTSQTDRVIEVEYRTTGGGEGSLRGGLLLAKGRGILEHSMAGCSRFAGATVLSATTTFLDAADGLPVAVSLISLGTPVPEGTPSRIVVASLQLALRRDGVYVSSQPTPLAYAQESAALQDAVPADVVAYISVQAWEATDVRTGLSRGTLEALMSMVQAEAGTGVYRTVDKVPSLSPLTPPNFWLASVSYNFPGSVTVHLAGRQRNLTNAIASLRVQCWSGGAGEEGDEATLTTVEAPETYVTAAPSLSNPLTTQLVSLAAQAGGATLLRASPFAHAAFGIDIDIPVPKCLDVVVTLAPSDGDGDGEGEGEGEGDNGIVSDVVYTNTGFFFAFGGSMATSTVEAAGTTGIAAAAGDVGNAVQGGNADGSLVRGAVTFRRGHTLSPILPRLPLDIDDIALAGMGTVSCSSGCDLATAGLAGIARSLSSGGGPVDLPSNVTIATALAFVPAGNTAMLELAVEYENGDDSVVTVSAPTRGCWSVLKVPVDSTRRPTTIVARSNAAGPNDEMHVTWSDFVLRVAQPAVEDVVLAEACGSFDDGTVHVDISDEDSSAVKSTLATSLALVAMLVPAVYITVL